MRFTISILLAAAILSPPAAGREHPRAETLASEGRRLIHKAAYHRAAAILRTAVQVLEKADDRRVLRGTVTSNLGVALYHLARFDEAEVMYLKASNDLEDGPLEELAAVLNNRAALYRRTGRYKDAAKLYEEVLRMYASTTGQESLATGIAWNNVAELHRSMGRFSEAETPSRRSVEILRRFAAAHPMEYADVLHTRAVIQFGQQKLDDARLTIAQSLQIRARAAGKDDPRNAPALLVLGSMQIATEQYAAAEQTFLEALRIWVNAFGPEHPDTAVAYNNLGQVYKLSGRYSEAGAMYAKALAMWERSGREHIEYALGVNNYADLLRIQGKLIASAKLYMEALPILRAHFGPGNQTVSEAERRLNEVVGASAWEAAQTIDYRQLRRD
jgi:tetratricopeptide (TPR) repeat protein